MLCNYVLKGVSAEELNEITEVHNSNLMCVCILGFYRFLLGHKQTDRYISGYKKLNARQLPR